MVLMQADLIAQCCKMLSEQTLLGLRGYLPLRTLHAGGRMTT